jgi:hypothetical protein
MTTNAPLMFSKWFRRKLCRDFPDDLRPSRLASLIAHSGTVLEFGVPVILLLSTNRTVTLAIAAIMVIFHLYITSNFPLAVPLEWNIFYTFSLVWLYVMHPSPRFGPGAMSSPWLTATILVILFGFPILGNLRPDLVSFLPAARYYAGNWATTLWAFRKAPDGQPDAEERIDTNVVKSSKNQIAQLTELYNREVAEIFLQKAVAWRQMHTHGRATASLLLSNLDNPGDYHIREGEFVLSSMVGWQFGDGHLHDEFFINAVQQRCQYVPGEVLVVYLESQPWQNLKQRYRLIDPAIGVIETGTVDVRDMVATQSWLPDGPIPFQVRTRTPNGGAAGQVTDRPSATSHQGD